MSDPHPFRVLVTGSRDHDPEWVCAQILGWWAAFDKDGTDRLILIHGDARGADQGAHLASLRIPGCAEVRVPAQWARYGKRAGALRNVEMVDLFEPDWVMAFPIGESRGTRHCMAAAYSRDIPVVDFEAPVR